jgi:hypothetical protein
MTMLGLVFGTLLLLQVGAFGCGDETGAGGTGGTVPLEPGPTCIAFCAHVVGECGAFVFDEASCRQGCERDLANERAISEACGDAVEAVFQCATDLDCEGVYAWRDHEPVGSYPCRAEAANADAVCGRN